MDEDCCRICFQKQVTLFSLYRKQQGCSPYDKLCNRLKLKIGEVGPSSICSLCLTELNTTISFLDKCEQSNQILSLRYKRLSEVQCQSNDLDHGNSDTGVVSQGKIEETGGAETSESEELEAGHVGVPTTTSLECAECGARRRSCRHRAPPAFPCTLCHKVFTRKFNFAIHLKRHLGQREWACATCGAAQLTRGAARLHCAPRPRRACPAPHCEKTFTTNTNLNNHIRMHNGERAHACGECGKRFTSRSSLTVHARTHTGVKPYMCAVCGARFASNKLAAHIRTHSAARPHTCAAPGCARTFRSARAARLHGATHTAGAAARRAHACSQCAARYAHRQSLNKHVRRHHPPGSADTDSMTELHANGCDTPRADELMRVKPWEYRTRPPAPEPSTLAPPPPPSCGENAEPHKHANAL